MLKKLLKYDFQSVMKYWWIVAVTSLVLSFVSGGCQSILYSDKELPNLVYRFVGLMNFIAIVGLVVLFFCAIILIFVRFYKNFFTDEGYLTFTLPTTKAKLINSKLIMGISTLLATVALYIVEIFIIFCIDDLDRIFTAKYWESLRAFISMTWDTLDGYTFIYPIEFLIIGILIIAFNILFTFCCITFAAMITKKAKVITAIGIYYGANSIFSFIVQIFGLFAIGHLFDRLSYLPDDTISSTLALGLLGIICSIFILCVILYTLLYGMIDRKLNLS